MANNDALTARLARAAVAAVAPEELPSFELLSAPYLRGKGTVVDVGELEFGAIEVVATVTPIATMVGAAVAGAALKGLSNEVEKSSGAMARRVVAVLRRRRTTLPDQLEWTPQQLTELRAMAVRQATVLGLDDATAGVLADAVVGALALRPDERP